MSHLDRSEERGFAILVLFLAIASASVGVLFAVQAMLPPLADKSSRTDRSLATAELAARDHFRRNGAFPGSLALLVASADGLTAAPWRTDPHGNGRDLNYGMVGTALRLRSRGSDGALNTTDDEQAMVPAEDLVRARQRARLRLIRAVFARSPYRYAGAMSPATAASMVSALRSHAIARRQWLTADASARVALQATMTAATSTVNTLASTYACPTLPPAVTGAGGLMEGIGRSDSLAVDGRGALLLLDATVGVLGRGSDGTGGTDDDM